MVLSIKCLGTFRHNQQRARLIYDKIISIFATKRLDGSDCTYNPAAPIRIPSTTFKQLFNLSVLLNLEIDKIFDFGFWNEQIEAS